MSPRRYRMDRRLAAREATRRRIVEATMALHHEQGILATSWEDIARRADVAVATVYRHFPSLNELIPACGALVDATIRPPQPEAAAALFADEPSLDERIARLVGEWCAFYARSRPTWDTVLRERHALPQLDEWAARQEATRAEFVRQALGPARVDDRSLRVVTALTGYPVWRALIDAGLDPDAATATLIALTRRWVAPPPAVEPGQVKPERRPGAGRIPVESSASAGWRQRAEGKHV